MRTCNTIITCALVLLQAANLAAFPPAVSRGVVSAPRPLLSELRSATGDDDESDLPPLPSAASAAPIEEPKPKAVGASIEEETTSYPLNFPSPLLLASSMLLTISSTGSIFKMFDEPPQLGFATTTAAIGIEFVLAGYLFYAAILKATAETEEDDREFNKPRKF